MTILLAKILVTEAMNNGHITTECAQHFINLIDENRFYSLKGVTSVNGLSQEITTINEFKTLNGTNLHCPLGQIGKVIKTYHDKSCEEFNVLKYITQTTFENGKIEENGTSTAYLANIIGQDFIGLDGYVNREFYIDELTTEEWLQIKNYLENTYEICAKRDVGRTTYTKSLIKNIGLKLKKQQLETELEEIEINPPQDEDADYLIHKIATLRKEIAEIEP